MGRGKGKVSCFNIMSCAGDGGDRDEMEPLTEVKDTKSRRRWSFQRRSSKEHCLDNMTDQLIDDSGIEVTVSAPADHNKLDGTSKNEACSSRVPEEPDRVPSIQKGARLEALPSSSVNRHSFVQLESAATALQTVVRGYLAKKELLKIKKIIKLQAAWRGHLVRKQAACTLRCIQAIAKMQAIVRARRKSNKENCEVPESSTECLKMNDGEFASTGKSSHNGLARCPSTEKILRNTFARVILESMPRKKPIYIGCDSSRSSSAWRWLDTWMAITLSDVNKIEEPDLDVNREEMVKKVDSYIASHNNRDVHNLKCIQPGSSSAMKNEQELSCITKGYSELIAHTSQDKNAKEAFDSLQSPVSPEYRIQTAILEDDHDASCSFSFGSPWKCGDEDAEVASEFGALEGRESESNDFSSVNFDIGHVNCEGKSPPSYSVNVGKDMPHEVKGLPQSSVPEMTHSHNISVCSTETSSTSAIEQSISVCSTEASLTSAIEQSTPNELQTITTSTSESQGSPSRHSLMKLKTSATTEKCSAWKKNSNMKTKRRAPKTSYGSTSTSDTLRSEDGNGNASDPLQTERNESTDHEPRASISDSLPSYMQLTKSARARFRANSSKATSLDLDDNSNSRNSVSIIFGVGKYDTSPRVVRLATQGKHNSKGKGQGPQLDTGMKRT